MSDFGKELEDRTLIFTVEIIRFSTQLPETIEGRIIRNQIAKSGSSVGANYREANRARSKADFKNKIKICESESSETLFWLEVISKLEWSEFTELNKLRTEANELLALFTSIGKKL